MLAVEARGRAPAPSVAYLMAQQALATVGTAIGRRPQLVIGCGVACVLDALALRLVQVRKVHLEEDTLLAARAVHDEDLGGRLGLDDNVLDLGGLIREMELIPCERFIPRVVHLLARLAIVCDDDDRAVVAKLIDVGARSRHAPRQPRVP